MPCQLYFCLDFCILQKPTRCSVQSVSGCPGVVLRQLGLNANVSRNLVFQPRTIKSVFGAVICLWIDTEDIKFESRCLSRVTTSPDCETCPQKAAAGRGFMGSTNYPACGYSYKLNVIRGTSVVNGSKLNWLPLKDNKSVFFHMFFFPCLVSIHFSHSAHNKTDT